MIVTVTPNPSLDRTVHLETFVHRGVNRVHHALREPSGKGVNVALALHTAGTETIAVLPLGGPAGHELAELLDATGLPVRIIPIVGAVRSNLSLVEADGSTTKVNEPGPLLSQAEVVAVIEEAIKVSKRGGWLAYCGSLPEGFTSAHLSEAIQAGRAAGRHVVVDTSDEPLQAMLASREEQLPTVVKPNTHELAAATSRTISTVGEVVEAAELLLRRGVETVLVSMGGDGAILLDRSGAIQGRAPVPRVINTVGAGDSFLAGYLHARDRGDGSREDALATALRWGAIAVQHAGTVFPGAEAVQQPVHLGPVLDVHRPLAEPAF
jgi:1-phosphofructokinase